MQKRNAYKKFRPRLKIIKRHGANKIEDTVFMPTTENNTMKSQIPEGICKDPEARLDAAVIALKTEHVQFHTPLLPNAD